MFRTWGLTREGAVQKNHDINSQYDFKADELYFTYTAGVIVISSKQLIYVIWQRQIMVLVGNVPQANIRGSCSERFTTAPLFWKTSDSFILDTIKCL